MRGRGGFGAVLVLWVTGCGSERGTIQVIDPNADGRPDDTEITGGTGIPDDSEPVDTTPEDPCGPHGGFTGALEANGPLQFGQTQGTSTFGDCTTNWTLYTPTTPSSTLVVLAHDGGRGPERVRGWAEHLAAWGYEVLTPTSCGGPPADEAALLVAAVDALAPSRPVIYAGHGSGGLAALLAAANDARTVGVLGLDPVDRDLLGRKAAASLHVPVRGIVGDPSLCNSSGNGRQIFRAAPDGGYLVVRDADHCDFENPTDQVCTAACSGSGLGELDDATQRRAIRGLVVAYALWASGDDVDGRGWWTRGCPPLDKLLGDGIVR